MPTETSPSAGQLDGGAHQDWAAFWPEVRTGTVEHFSDHRGLGGVRDGHGRAYPFHCLAIADGTRTIQVGALVAFGVGLGPGGELEAQRVTKTVAPKP